MDTQCWGWDGCRVLDAAPPARLHCFAIVEQVLEQPAEGRKFSAW